MLKRNKVLFIFKGSFGFISLIFRNVLKILKSKKRKNLGGKNEKNT